MAQFDVHRNLGASRARYPLLVVVQSGLLRRWDRRVVVPLAVAAPFPGAPDPQLNPAIEIGGVRLYIAAQEITNVPMGALGEVVDNLRDRSETVIKAIDWMLSQGFG